MIQFENRNPNLDLVDTFDLQKIKVNRGVIYTGDTKAIKEKRNIREKPQLQKTSLAPVILGENNTLGNATPNDLIWTDIDAQTVYLKTKPTCYLILSKPGAGAYRLGEDMSKKLQCIHLCPANIISDEIAQNSPTGKTLDFNLRYNKVCSFSIILELLRRKLNSESVKHRGYILSGLPLVSCLSKPTQLVTSLHSEKAYLESDAILFDMICNLKKKKPKEIFVSPSGHTTTKTSTVPGEHIEEEEEHVEEENPKEEAEEEEEQPAELPKFILDSCSDIITHKDIYLQTYQAIILEQLEEIFNCDPKPDIILYMTCPDTDLITKRSHKYINYKTGHYVIEPFNVTASVDLRWPCHYNLSDFKNTTKTDLFSAKYNCKNPTNFYNPSVRQICNYKNDVYNYIEKKIRDYDPKLVIKLDARTSADQMLYQVTQRLHYIQINPVIIPEPLLLEEPPEDMEEFWKLIEEYKPIKSGVITFNRYASPWFNRCPVELKNRRTVIGKPKYAVQMFKHVYMMCSNNNFVSFCRNPRPFLQIKYLEPTCRVIILGTKSSGKTMIAKCLSWLFDTPIIERMALLDRIRAKKRLSYSKTILSELIATIEDARFAVWQRLELDRGAALNEWQNHNLQLLAKYWPLLIQWLTYNKEKSILEEETNIKGEITEEEQEMDSKCLEEYNKIRDSLSFLPILDDVNECEALLSAQNILKYAPTELITVTPQPPIPKLGDDDVTKAISDYIIANDLQKEMEPTTEDLSHELVMDINIIDSKVQSETNYKQHYGKYIMDGFPSDLECWDYLGESKQLPDYTIALIENKEVNQELIQNYAELENKLKNYTKIFLSAKDPLIQTKLCLLKPKHCNKINAQIILNDLVADTLPENVLEGHIENVENNNQQSFSEAIDKFREDWDSIKIKLEEKSLCFIEIELENKTDVEIVEEVLLKLRKSYMVTGERSEGEENDALEEDNETQKNPLTYNDNQFLCETNIYCPLTYYKYGIFWEGKPEFSFKYNNKVHKFCNEEFMEQFEKDVTKYQNYNNPYNPLPPTKICIIGCVGSGTSSVSKQIAKELGLMHIDFKKYLVNHVMPKHYKKVGRPYENPFTDDAIDDESVVEYQQTDEENEDVDIVVSEKELRRYLYNYLENGGQMLPGLMQKALRKIWFEIASASIGFVLDGYPRTPNDVEDMIASFGIPDLAIELEGTIESSSERLIPKMMKKWKTQLTEAKNLARVNFGKIRQEWTDTITKSVVVKLIIEELLDTMSHQFGLIKYDSNQSAIIDADAFGSERVDPVLFSTYNEVVQENPEPEEAAHEWEKSEDAKERFESRIEAIFDTDSENIQAIKDMFLDQNIKCVTVDASKSLDKVIRRVLSKLTSLRQRDEESFLEQTFVVKPEMAEILLSQGFYFLSRFNRMCPVYMYENRKTINNPYMVFCKQGNLFPILHRTYIYFIGGESSVIKFRKSPLKYTTCDAIKDYIEYPLRIGIIGTPKSGKSVMAAKIAKRYGLLCISRGMALRNIVENMPWTNLGAKVLKKLHEGAIVDINLLVKAVQTSTIDYRTYTSGYVLDGFPYGSYVAGQLDKAGLFPNMILDVSSNEETVITNLQNEIYYDILKYKPPYSIPFIQYRITEWRQSSYKIRNWINDDHQNIRIIDGDVSKWQCLRNANVEIDNLIAKIYNYFFNVDKTIVPVFDISNSIFEQRMSQYKNLCPVCFRMKILKHSGLAKDKTGVVQYRNTFYWICEDHLNVVLTHPNNYLTPQYVQIPEIPAIIKNFNKNFVYENGICIVTYAENLPNHRIIKGSPEFVAAYRGTAYMFCDHTCLHKFLQKPQLYYDIKVFNARKDFPKLCLKSLPNLGYLEQTLGNILTEACCSVNVLRPKYPGLSLQLSAFIYLGLYIKTRNPSIAKDKIPMYVKALEVFEARCRLINKLSSRLRSMENPFASYPKCHHKPPKYYSPKTEDFPVSSVGSCNSLISSNFSNKSY